MSFFNQSENVPIAPAVPRVEIRPLMRLVYMWMGFGLLVTALVAAYIGSNVELLATAARFFWIAIIIELGLVIGISAAMNRLSPTVAAGMFFLYAVMNGVTLSFIFYAYELGTIYTAFFATAGMFGVMSIIGMTTNIDLSRYSSLFVMGLIGLVIALVLNMFMPSDGFSIVISLFGVVLFLGLTAWDTQKIKNMAANPEIEASGDLTTKMAILGALMLYLDFVNLFLFILRLLGSRD
ncbi:MAG: Bax inhibitor-1/YccA family protein [Chloroflexi bacterium]|nr:MAG: Bax inhibitor-1/YccA family protein [Chloroflexota bacterium]